MSMRHQVEDALRLLVGSKLLRSRSFWATRHFYFGNCASGPHRDEAFTLVIECPWRIEQGKKILTGSEDYRVKADDNVDPSWVAGMSRGNLQNEKLREFMGEMVDEEIILTRGEIKVSSVQADDLGGFRIELSNRAFIAIFPSTSREMEWMLSRTSGGSVVLMNGSLEYTKKNADHLGTS